MTENENEKDGVVGTIKTTENADGTYDMALGVDSDHATAIAAFLREHTANATLALATLGATVELMRRNMKEPFDMETSLELVGKAARAAEEQWKSTDVGMSPADFLATLPDGVQVVSLDDPAELHDTLHNIFGE